MCSTDIFLGVLAFAFPPLPVWVKCGICSAESLLNILLCMLGFVPGLLHSWYIIAKFPEPAWEYETVPDAEPGNRVTYVFVRDDGHRCEHSDQYAHAQNPRYNVAGQPRPQPQQPPQPQGYGTQGQGGAGYPVVPQQPSVAPGGQARLARARDEAAAAAAGPSTGGVPEDGSVPPSYAEAVGDHKIQDRD